ncbi:AAA family ATPase [uncultured Pseudoflavonifractor sp.]|uniref:AAA family ATPase n=1 Tax=uncultured Pseudoflavonifractor sp. TaxID=1221379 RepID=UPI0025FCC1DB|nr:AAA family ATPase [uncultured Pseudoflavonifractor sp.]
MKKTDKGEKRSLIAVCLPEALVNRRIQNLVGRFVEEDGELGFVFHSNRYGGEAMHVELKEPRLRALLLWLAEKKETMLLTGRRDRMDPDMFQVWGLDPGGPGSSMPTLFIGEKKTNLSLARLNAMLRHLGIETAEQDLTVQDGQEEFQTEEELKLLLRVCGEGYPPEIRAWAERTLDQCEKVWSGTERERQHAVRALTYALNINWNVRTLDLPSLEEARQIMDSTFYGLEPVKQRMLEVLAQMKRTGTMPSWGLLLDGPAGVGKTSIAKAWARIFRLPMVVLDMSTIRDVEDLTGSSRIYSNGRPGRIMQQLYAARSANVIMVINELDKAGGGNGKGNPADALLTLLDGTGFTDTFMDVAIPTRGIFFVGTCNELGDISRPIRDRFLRISIPGYSGAEKKEIFSRYTLPKLTGRMGIAQGEFTMTPQALEVLCTRYATEPGARDLEQYAEKLLSRYLYRRESGEEDICCDLAMLRSVLGPERCVERTMVFYPGMVNGVFRGEHGVKCFPIQAAVRPGSGSLRLIGVHREELKESCQVAYEFVRRVLQRDVRSRVMDVVLFVSQNVDDACGNSLGVAAAAAILSALTGRDFGPDCAFLGSCDLYGNTYFDDISADAYLDALEASGVTTVYAAAGTGAKLYQYRSGRDIRVVEAANLSMLLEAAASSLPAALKNREKEE